MKINVDISEIENFEEINKIRSDCMEDQQN